MANEPPPSHALREALPTTKHAAALFDMVVARLGDRAVVQTSDGGRSRVLHVRAGGGGAFLIPWPLLTLSLADPPPEGEPEPDETPVVLEPGSTLHLEFHDVPGSVVLNDGDAQVSVAYRRNGRLKDSSDPGRLGAFSDLAPALARATDNRLELLAEYVASIDLGRHGPARVILPRLVPGGVGSPWAVGRNAIRVAIDERRAPAGSFWAVADGYVGTALAFGTSRDAAIAKWRDEVARLRPQPAPPPDPLAPSAPETFLPTPGEWRPDDAPEPVFRGAVFSGGWDAPPFDPSPEATPAAAVRIAALPASKPARGRWTRWIGERGTTHFAVRLDGPGGFTLIGESLLPRFDLATIEATLDALDAVSPALRVVGGPPPAGVPHATHLEVHYLCVDPRTGSPVEPCVQTADTAPGFHVAGFRGERLLTHVVRVRQIA